MMFHFGWERNFSFSFSSSLHNIKQIPTSETEEKQIIWWGAGARAGTNTQETLRTPYPGPCPDDQVAFPGMGSLPAPPREHHHQGGKFIYSWILAECPVWVPGLQGEAQPSRSHPHDTGVLVGRPQFSSQH